MTDYDKSKVSPGPWKHMGTVIFSADGMVIDASDICLAGRSAGDIVIDAAYIVHCVNTHDELVKALEWALEHVSGENSSPYGNYEGNKAKAWQALAKAKGDTP